MVAKTLDIVKRAAGRSLLSAIGSIVQAIMLHLGHTINGMTPPKILDVRWGHGWPVHFSVELPLIDGTLRLSWTPAASGYAMPGIATKREGRRAGGFGIVGVGSELECSRAQTSNTGQEEEQRYVPIQSTG